MQSWTALLESLGAPANPTVVRQVCLHDLCLTHVFSTSKVAHCSSGMWVDDRVCVCIFLDLFGGFS